MADSDAFREGMRAYHAGDRAAAVRALTVLTGRDDLMGRLARYYCAMVHRALGIEDLQGGRLQPAIAHLRQAVTLVGNKPDLAEYLLMAYAKTRQYARAGAEADVLAENHRHDVAARVRLAQTQWRSGQRPLALLTLTGAVRELGDHADLHLQLGLFHAAGQEYELACRHLERAAECDCTSVKAYRYLGLTYSALGQFHKAAGAFARALALAGEDLLLAFQLCQAADAARRMGRAFSIPVPEPVRLSGSSQIRQLADYAVSEAGFIEAFLALPESPADEELFTVVTSILRTALGVHPDYADLHCFASLALRRLKDLEGAILHARRAVQINPSYIRALVHLAELEAAGGDVAAAVEHLRRAVQAGADWADVHLRLGDWLRESGDRADSARHYRRALELNRNLERASAALVALAA